MGRPQDECAALAACTADVHQALGFVPDAGAVAAALARRLAADFGGALQVDGGPAAGPPP
jgi:hypothetical protein